jgi:hypothetical protein
MFHVAFAKLICIETAVISTFGKFPSMIWFRNIVSKPHFTIPSVGTNTDPGGGWGLDDTI